MPPGVSGTHEATQSAWTLTKHRHRRPDLDQKSRRLGGRSNKTGKTVSALRRINSRALNLR